MDHGSTGEEQGRSRGERGRKQQERERIWELLTGRTGEGKNQAGNWQQRQNLRRSGKEWETSGEEASRIGKGQERTWKGRGRTREVSYIMQRTCSIQFGSTYMQQCIYYFMLSVSVLDQVGSNLFNFSNAFNCFLFVFFTLALGVLFCAFWVPGGCKGGSKEASGSSFWTTKVDKTCPRPWK